MSRSGPGGDTRAYIWPRSWRKLETLTAPIRPGCAFDPKDDSRQPCARSEPEALTGLLAGHLFLYEKIATSSTLSNPPAASPELFPVSQSATDAANRRTIGLPGSKSADRRRSSEAADAAAAAQPTAAANKGFPRLAAPLA
jgi:hypothetical protein